MCKLVTIQFAKKWFDIGTRYNSACNIKKAIDMAYNDGFEIGCWEQCAAFEAGYKGYEFKIETFERYGKMNIGQDGFAERSINHAQNEFESGVSVITPEWSDSLIGRVSYEEFTRDGVKKISVTGLVIGYGSDGEKLILPVQL